MIYVRSARTISFYQQPHWHGRADAPSRLSLLTVSFLNSSFLLPAARSFQPLQLICVKEKLYRKLVDKVEKYILVIKIKTTPKGGIALQVGSVHTLLKYVLSNSTSHIMPPLLSFITLQCAKYAQI